MLSLINTTLPLPPPSIVGYVEDAVIVNCLSISMFSLYVPGSTSIAPLLVPIPISSKPKPFDTLFLPIETKHKSAS